MPILPPIKATRKNGSDPIHDAGRPLGFDLNDFWRWASSDLVSNVTRGVVAEYLVAKAVGLNPDAVRVEWDAYDLTSPEGIKIEVKSAAYIQSWHQPDYSRISFRVPKTLGWDAETNVEAEEAKRHAEVYVLCLLKNRDQESLDPLDVSQWDFYVLPTSVLNERKRSQHSITLPSLEKLCDAVSYGRLQEAILGCAQAE